MTKAEKIVRDEALYLVEGVWPEVIQQTLPDGVFEKGRKYIVAILPSKE